MSSYAGKRKRSAFATSLMAARPYATPVKRRKKITVVAGRTRVAGFYGRYPPSGGELKFHDVGFTDAVIAQGGVIQDTVIVIPQGVTEIQRIGRKCTLKSINWKFRLSIPEQDAVGTPASGDVLRIILYQDKQTNGAAAVTTDILENSTIHSYRNLANSTRFNVLMDKLIVLNYSTLASDGAGVVSQDIVRKEFTFYKKCNIPIEYNSTTGALTEIRTNNIGICLVSLSGVGGINSDFRFRFSDN